MSISKLVHYWDGANKMINMNGMLISTLILLTIQAHVIIRHVKFCQMISLSHVSFGVI